MTSNERREARYQRRRARRLANKKARNAEVGSLAKAFSYREMFLCGKKCCNNVRWKQSTQNFELYLFSGTARRRRLLLEGKWKPKKCTHFTLHERGKIRPIDAPHIEDRQIHKTECKRVLIPLYSPSMIYDNGASQKNRGLHWHFKRIKNQLHWHFRRYVREGAVLLITKNQLWEVSSGEYNHYITVRRARIVGICGEVNIPYGTEIEAADGFLMLDGKPLCAADSQNAYDYFAVNDDGCGLERGKLTMTIRSGGILSGRTHYARNTAVLTTKIIGFGITISTMHLFLTCIILRV